MVYSKNHKSLAYSQLSDKDTKRLYVLDSSTISLFKDILQGVGRNSITGKKREVLKYIPLSKRRRICHVLYFTAKLKNTTVVFKRGTQNPLKPYHKFDRGYVDYTKYQEFTKAGIWYVTRLKVNADYEARKEYDIPENTDSKILKDERIILKYGKKKEFEHFARRIVVWDDENKIVF